MECSLLTVVSNSTPSSSKRAELPKRSAPPSCAVSSKIGSEPRKSPLPTPGNRLSSLSPRTRAILEIQSQRDLEILEKIYANSVLLGDDGPDGWGIRYATEFHMTGDSKLFPPRPQWEAQGYRPDEYSRWLKGDWRPIEALWTELGVDPSTPAPSEIELEDGCSTLQPDRSAVRPKPASYMSIC